jgi:hypothetical protein
VEASKPKPNQPAADADVDVSFRSIPLGATVSRADGDKAELGVTPFTIKLPAKPRDVSVVFKHDGFETTTIHAHVASGREVNVTLKNAKPKQAPPSSSSSSSSSPSTKSGTDNAELIDPFGK